MSERHITDCPIFGNSSELSEKVLPVYSDVMKFYLHERIVLKQKSKKDPSVSEISKGVVNKIISLWEKASIPCVSNERVKKMITDYHQKYRNILKYIKSKKNNMHFKNKCENFKKTAENTLFDISACKCKSFINCTCLRKNKVPEGEQQFLQDQRSTRKMATGGVDRISSKKNFRMIERKRYLKNFKKNKGQVKVRHN